MGKNYQRILDGRLADIAASGRVPTLLLHSCCAPCSTYCVECLAPYFSITVFYYNPNISPEEEYKRRADEQREFLRKFDAPRPISFMEGEYDPERFYNAVRGLEGEREGGGRCERCFSLRLMETAARAREIGADYFSTTLTISPLKNARAINEAGEEAASLYGVEFLNSDFKKRDGFKRSVELSNAYGLYRQDYCGCVFSKREREEKKGAAMDAKGISPRECRAE